MVVGDQSYQTHFEKAAELGIRPSEVKRMARASMLGDYGHIGGVFYFPTAPLSDERRDDFFRRMIAIRHKEAVSE